MKVAKGIIFSNTDTFDWNIWMRTIFNTFVLGMSIIAEAICLRLGVTIDEWTSLFGGPHILYQALLIGTTGVLLMILSIAIFTRTIRSFYQGTLRLYYGIQIVLLFSLAGFGFGLLVASLNRLIYVYCC